MGVPERCIKLLDEAVLYWRSLSEEDKLLSTLQPCQSEFVNPITCDPAVAGGTAIRSVREVHFAVSSRQEAHAPVYTATRHVPA